MKPTDYRKLYRTLTEEQHALWEDSGDDLIEAVRLEYQRRWSDSLSLQELVAEADGTDSAKIRELISNEEFDTDPNEFHKSYTASKRLEYLTPYSPDELSGMKTYKVRGYNAGFAVKSDGDIVSVHNNTGSGGLAPALIKSAIQHGGKKLDHFDGGLTKLYRSLGFHVVNVVGWDDQYASPNWKYVPIDLSDPNVSVYGGNPPEWPHGPKIGSAEWNEKRRQYKSGKPDIIYRQL